MKRSGRKSAAQTPAPPSERIKGSKRNPKGSAASSESANKINLSENIVRVLKDKADAYNEKHPKNKVSVSTLKAVFRRGAGAYSSSHRPTITGGRPNSRTAWAYARVNKFLLKKGGTKVKAAYVQDDDLMEKGGEIFKPTLTIQDLARKHNVTVSEVLKKLTLGIEKELEHTEDAEVAKIIALHHIEENIEYYDVLKENELEEGAIIESEVVEPKQIVALPDTYSNVDSLKGILAMQGYEIKPIVEAVNVENKEIMKEGGVVVGKSHQEADENGTGEKFVVASTGQIVELEGGEAVIVNKAMDSSDMLTFEGKEMTPKEIASYLNHAYGGVKFEQGGEVTCGCSHKKYYHGGELPSEVVDGLQGGEAVITKKTMESSDKYMFEGQKLTPRQILSRINHKYGGVSFARGGITGKVKHSEENKMSKMIYFINNVNYG